MIEIKLVEKLKQMKYKISFAESCTGGLLASTIINVSGSSSVIEESYITYSENAKMKLLDVKKESNLSNKDLALKVLDYFHESGLYTVSQSTDGSYSVNLTKISDEEYETAYTEISKRNNQGLLK